MKKKLTYFMALTLMLSLTACNGKESESKKTENNNQSVSDKTQSSTDSKNSDFTALDVKKGDRKSDMEITDLKMGKKSYEVDEPVSVTVSWKGTPYDDAWIGIIPYDVSHGSEEENDVYDVCYYYFSELESGKSFDFDTHLEPGEYTVRVNESDNGGPELAWCAFTVTGSTEVPTESNETDTENDIPVDVDITGKTLADVNYDNYSQMVKREFGIDISEADGWKISFPSWDVSPYMDNGVYIHTYYEGSDIKELIKTYYDRCSEIADDGLWDYNYIWYTKDDPYNEEERKTFDQCFDDWNSDDSDINERCDVRWAYSYNGNTIFFWAERTSECSVDFKIEFEPDEKY